MSLNAGHFDVCVLGSGFAGSLTALILANAGMSVAIADRGTHPRFAIGESSTPAADYLLHQLSVQHKIAELLPLCRFGSWLESYPQVRCGCKRGFSYIWHGAGTDYRASATHDCELMVTANASAQVADTQWYRPDVDQFLFQLAVHYGVKAFESTEIVSVQREPTNGRAVWNLLTESAGGSQTITADFVVDASGPSSRFIQSLSPQDLTATLLTNTSAVYTHVENCGSAMEWLEEQGASSSDFPYPVDQAAVHHLFHDGWLWQIGFEGNLTSIGFVQANGRLAIASSPSQNSLGIQANAHRHWQEILKRRPVLKSILKTATLAAVPGQMLAASRVQRLSSLASGPDWVALPFTVGFIDPLHSTGIAHSLSGIKRICDGLLTNCQTERSQLLTQYASDLLEEFRFLDQMISGCYDALGDFRLFNCWTMLYFAAATTYEQKHRSGEASSFLLGGDKGFQRILKQARASLDKLSSRCSVLNDQAVESYQREISDLIAPYNRVGLFAPGRRNMYWHTAAAK